MKVHISLIFSAIVAIGCSGGGSDSKPECGSNASCAPPQLNPALSITGIWNRTKITNDQEDILFTYIGEDGEFLVYDYQQDDFGSSENCHTLETATIFRSTESSNYSIRFNNPRPNPEDEIGLFATIFLEQENLSVQWDTGENEIWSPITGQSTDDLVLCQ